MTTAPSSKPKPSAIFLDDDAEAFTAEYVERMLASAAGLARICALMKCRRRRRCFGPYDGGLPCTRHHQGLCQARFAAALRRLCWANVKDEAQ
jgi:hypothetical protein